LAPIAYIPADQTPGSSEEVGPTETERGRKERLPRGERMPSAGLVEIFNSETLTPPVRGFGKEYYKDFPEEMLTDVDVEKLIHDLRRSGTEVNESVSRVPLLAYSYHCRT
jgi:hypothetical protein